MILPTFAREAALMASGRNLVAGCDEAGRGPIAGPVVAAAVILDPDRIPSGLADSKKLSRGRREELFDAIIERSIVAIASASPARIARDNILQASLWAMAAAAAALPTRPDHILIDGRDQIRIAIPCEAVIGGDASVLTIAAASIVAKVTRDRLMAALGREHPGYGFERHAGYGTPEHLDALRRYGPTPHHRRTFAPVAAMLSPMLPLGESASLRSIRPPVPLEAPPA